MTLRALAPLAVLGALVTACDAMDTSESDNEAVVRQVYAASAAGDAATLLSLLDENVEWRLAESEGLPYAVDNPYLGPQAVAAKLGEVRRVMSYDHTIDEYFDAGDAVIVTGSYEGVYLPTDAAFATPFVHVWRVRNGKIVAFRQYVDAAPLVRAASDDPAR